MKRKIKAELVVFKDEPTGEIGFRLDDAPESEGMYAARDGALIAHDLLEHVNGPEVIGDIGDELEALGALWWSRGHLHDLSRNGVGSAYTPHENVASDVSEMLRKCLLCREPMPTAPRTRAGDFEQDISEIIEHGYNSARAEAMHDPDEAKAFNPRDAREFLKVARSRMRIGLRKARRRWPDASDMNTAFWAVAEAVERAAKGIEYEGQRFALVYDPATLRATCEEVYPDEY